MVINAYFGIRRTNRSDETPYYGPVSYKIEVDYYIQTCCSTEKLSHIRIKTEKGMSGSNVFF